MKNALQITIVIMVVIFSYGICLSAQPTEKFLTYNLRSVYAGMGDGGTQQLRVTLKDFVNLGLRKGSWEKVRDTQWIYRIKSHDPLTKKHDEIVLLFSRVENNREMQEFFKDDVILSRVVINKQELSASEIFAFSWKIATNIYPMTEYGKQEIKKQEEQKKKDEELREKEEAIRKQKEEEEQRKAEEEKQRKMQEKLMVKNLKKQECLKSIPGHYENLQGGSKKHGGTKKYGEMDIQLLSDDSIMFSGYNNMGQTCKFENKKARLEKYVDYRDIYIAIFEEINDVTDKKATNNCRIEMEFGKYKEHISAKKGTEHFLKIERVEGRCHSYCERGGSMMGRYDKVGTPVSSNQKESGENQTPAQLQSPDDSNLEKKDADNPIKVLKGIFGGK